MAKDQCETSRALSISWLKRRGILVGYYTGNVTWTLGQNKSSVGITVTTSGANPNIQLKYRMISTNESLDYPVQLTTTPCFFGGKRFWFVCPLYRNGIPCQRRVGVIYLAGKWFGCRKCYDLAYTSQQQTHSAGRMGLLYGLNQAWNLEEKTKKIRTKYWHGKPTKRYAKLLKKTSSMDQLFQNEALRDKALRELL